MTDANTVTPRPVTIGVSLKTYFGHGQAREWFAAVAESIRSMPAIADGSVTFFVVPTYLQLHLARDAFAGTPVRIGAQDVSQYGPGPYTGEISAAELAEVGVSITEIGHAERRRLFGEDSALVAHKATAALTHGIEPLLCVGESHRGDPQDAAAATVAQLAADLHGAPAGPVIVAYEPVWAIGAPEPAPADHIVAVTRALRAALLADPARAGSAVIYGGSAGPGLLASLGDAVDGLFLGRFAHDVTDLATVLTEASALALSREGSLS
ncbi:triose-phosphate isomerase family protein [Microbacterium rhizomatis]|uniref:Triosephosphate isomerase n=1 Tax=Microbacterium rhizomatis TaxID=1631477 RepID=A0A5J5J0T0_9MICO|nr:triose-phosphate isomerase family protein [Microbacterium rhizomatis]KAA9108136.1 triosephosphate isomerase [Microbacterium rhizomatis]